MTRPATSERQTYTVDQAAALLCISRNSAYKAVRRGEIPTIKIGRRLLVPRAALERMLAGEASVASQGVITAGRAQHAPRVRPPSILDDARHRILVAEVRRLRDGIRTKVEWWDRVEPDAMAFRVTADFRTLIGDDDEGE